MNNINFDPKRKKLGQDGEEKARLFLKELGLILSKPDFAGYFKEKRLLYQETIESEEDIEFEIKTKAEPFVPPPILGHGTDIYQINKRMRRYHKYGIKQFFLIIQPDGKMYGQWLHKLEQLPDSKKFNTKNDLRIYSLNEFFKISNI